MRNHKKFIAIIDKFPKILYTITKELKNNNLDYILDATGYHQPIPLLNIVYPEMVMFNLKLPRKKAIQFMSETIHDSPEINRGMITNNAEAYYLSLCSTFSSRYFIDKSFDLDSILDSVSKQQLN